MGFKKILSISLKMIYIKIRVEYTIKHTILAQLEEEKVRIFWNKLRLTLLRQQKEWNIKFNFKEKILVKLVMVIDVNQELHPHDV